MKKIIVLYSFVAILLCFSMHGSYASESGRAAELLGILKKQDDTSEDAFNARYDGLLKNAQSKEERVAIIQSRGTELASMHKKGYAAWQAYKWVEVTEQLTKPRTVGILAAGALGIFGAWHGTSLVRDILRHKLLIPPLAQKTSIRSWSDKVKNIFVSQEFVSQEDEVILRSDVIFEKGLTDRAKRLTTSLKNTVLNGSDFRHYLFYGPPGTGKTMLAMAMAHEAGLEYMYFSAAKLQQYSLEEGVRQLTHLFEYAKSYSKKLMIIMDEGDCLYADRDTCSEKMLVFLNLILTYVGTESPDFVLFVLTNKLKVFDRAALNRFGEIIKVGTPGFDERVRLFGNYAMKYLVNAHQIRPDRRTFLQKFFTVAPRQRTVLTLASHLFTTEELLNDLALKGDGLVGRDIRDIMLSVQSMAYEAPDHVVTQAMLYSALEMKKADKKIIANRFKN